MGFVYYKKVSNSLHLSEQNYFQLGLLKLCYLFAATGIKSQYSTNEIKMWFDSVTTEDNHLKRKLFEANTTFSKFVYLTILVSQENWSLQLSKTTSESTNQVPELCQSIDNKDILFEINKPFITSSDNDVRHSM